MIFGNVVYVYVCKKCEEKFGGCWRSFSWLGQKVTDNHGLMSYMHWTAASAAREAPRAAELVAKVTSAQDVLPTSGLLATAMEMPNIDRILAVNITV